MRLFLRSPFIVFGAMVMAFTIDVKGGHYFCCSDPGCFAVVVFGIMLIDDAAVSEGAGAVWTRILGITRENLTGVRVIRAFRKRGAGDRDRFEQEQWTARRHAAFGRDRFPH